MGRLTYLLNLCFLFLAFKPCAQSTDSLKQVIQRIVSEKKATVGVAINDQNGKEILSINAELHFPLQSVFKFPIALAVLSGVDKGIFSLSQKISIEKKDLVPNTHSPIRDEYPNGTSLAISKILEYTVSQSDNIGCDVLLRLIGGPQQVEKYFKNKGFQDLSIKTNEEVQQSNWDLQFQNWITPRTANKILMSYYDNKTKLLTPNSHDFIWKIMKETQTGPARLRGQLPGNTIVAHKTGSSGTNKDGLTAAVNDIGIIFLPGRHYFFISVFVTKSTENTETNEKIIADLSKATWDYYKAKSK